MYCSCGLDKPAVVTEKEVAEKEVAVMAVVTEWMQCTRQQSH